MPGKYIEERRYNEGIELDFPIPPPDPGGQPGGITAPGTPSKTGQVTLEQFTADQNDLTLPEGHSFRMSTDGVARTITGFSNVRAGRVVYLHNRSGGANISLANDNAGSTTEYRIITGTGGTVAIQPDRGATLLYDGEDKRWLLQSYT